MDTKLILFSAMHPYVSSLQSPVGYRHVFLLISKWPPHTTIVTPECMHDLGHYDNLVHCGGQDLWRTGSMADRVHYQISQMFPPYTINLSHHISTTGNNSIPYLC